MMWGKYIGDSNCWSVAYEVEKGTKDNLDVEDGCFKGREMSTFIFNVGDKWAIPTEKSRQASRLPFRQFYA